MLRSIGGNSVVLGVLMFWIASAHIQQSMGAELQITYPASGSTVPTRIVEVRGTGADPSGTIEVEVLTNQWYPQDGMPRINADGSWSYGPCHLAGEGEYNNHTIRVTIIKGGKRGESTSVGGIVRQP